MRYCPAHEACPILPTSWATTQLVRYSGLPSVPQTVNCAEVTSSNKKGSSVHFVHFGVFWETGTNKMSTSARHEFQDYRHSTRNKQNFSYNYQPFLKSIHKMSPITNIIQDLYVQQTSQVSPLNTTPVKKSTWGLGHAGMINHSA